MTSRFLKTRLGWLLPAVAAPGQPVLVVGETLPRFVWRISARHQIYVSLLAVAIAILNFAPVELQRRIIDDAIVNRNTQTLINFGTIFLVVILLQSVAKYILSIYQSWVSETAVKGARDELAQIAIIRKKDQPTESSSGQTSAILGSEIDQVGGFIGASISEAVVNVTFIVVTSIYLIYVNPWIGFGCLLLLIPQVFVAPYLQPHLDKLVEKQVGLVRTLGDRVTSQRPKKAIDTADSSETIRSLFSNKMLYFSMKFAQKGLLNFLSSLAPLAAIIVGGYFVINGELSIGALVAFVSGLDRLATPLRDLLNFYRDSAQTRVHHTMILDWVGSGPSMNRLIVSPTNSAGKS